MEIGSATSWDIATHAGSPPVQGPAVPAEQEAEELGAPREAGGARRNSEVVAEAARSGNVDPSQRPPEEQAEIAELKRRDQEVRQHEAAHMSAGGAYVRGGASYSYQAGPDGRRYAVGGEVSIDASPVANNPEATIAKMRAVRGAALAPANPSGQDISVAARAAQAEMQARMQAAEEAVAAAREEDPAQSPSGEEATSGEAPSSPADVVGPAPVSSGTVLDTYA